MSFEAFYMLLECLLLYEYAFRYNLFSINYLHNRKIKKLISNLFKKKKKKLHV